MPSKKELLLFYIKFRKIKNNSELAKLLNTTPKTVSVLKNRLLKEGLVSKNEVLERKFNKKRKEKEEDIFDFF